MQPDGRRAGAAVVKEGDGAGFGGRAVLGVGDVEDAAVGLVVFVLDEQVAGGRGVVDGVAAGAPVVLRFGLGFGRNGEGVFGLVLFHGLRLFGVGAGLDGGFHVAARAGCFLRDEGGRNGDCERKR